MAGRIRVGEACVAAFAVAVGLVGNALAAEGDLPLDRGVGRQVANFTLEDATNKEPVSLYGFFGKKAIVLVFLGTECPVGNLYIPRLVELSNKYKDKGVVFLGINSNADETAQQVAEHAKEHDIDFRVLKDPDNIVADLNLVERTCEALVVDGRARLRYRGAIDDQYVVGSRKEAATKTYLADALEAVIAGRTVDVPATVVAGCPIERVPAKVATQQGPKVRAAAPEIIAALEEKEKTNPESVGPVNYAHDVAPILQNKCQSCHRPGQVGPFALLTYDQARRWAASIREVVDERRMPPWHADPRYSKFENDRSLSARQRAVLLAWVDQGSPLGDPRDLPAPRTFPESWTIGKPDLVIEIPEPYIVSAQGVLPYQYFKIPTGFTEDRWIEAAEAHPGDRSVVHHIIVFVDDHSPKRDRGERMGAHLVGYAPGDLPSVYPGGTAKRVPAGSDFIFQIHYTPNGQVKTDRSSVGLIFSKEPPKHRAVTKGIAQQKFAIPPGAASHKVESSWTFPSDSHLLSFMPHMHLRGKDFKYTATYPDGRTETLLSVPAFDFGWQSAYRLAEPLAMPKGTRIDCVAHFDNSAENAANPDPKKTVYWGEQTFEEMMIGYIDFTDDAPVDQTLRAEKAADNAAQPPAPARNGNLARALRALVRAQRSASSPASNDR